MWRSYTIRDRLTPSRVARLETLSKGPARRPGNAVGFQCATLGWAEWLVERRGETLAISVVRDRYPDYPSMWADGWCFTDKEVLTALGRAKLTEARAR